VATSATAIPFNISLPPHFYPAVNPRGDADGTNTKTDRPQLFVSIADNRSPDGCAASARVSFPERMKGKAVVKVNDLETTLLLQSAVSAPRVLPGP
jgi:hypothetical protein